MVGPGTRPWKPETRAVAGKICSFLTLAQSKKTGYGFLRQGKVQQYCLISKRMLQVWAWFDGRRAEAFAVWIAATRRKGTARHWS